MYHKRDTVQVDLLSKLSIAGLQENRTRPLTPRLEGGSAQIHAIDEELQRLGVELDAALSRLAGGGPAESAFFQTFCREP